MKVAPAGIVLASVALAIAVPLGAGAAASGSGVHPTTAEVTGSVVDSASHPLNGICIAVVDTDGNFAGQSQTTATGSYDVTGILPGTYTITYQDCDRSTGPNVEPQYYNNAQVYASRQLVALAAGQTTTLDTQSMQGGAQVTLHLTDSHGNPVSGVEVSMETQSAPALLPSVGSVARFDAAGNATFVGLFPVPYTLEYFSCPQFSCAVVGYYPNDPSNRPSTVQPVVGTPTSLTDTLDVPAIKISTLTMTASPASPTVGQPVTLTANVANPDGSIPDGYVQFTLGTTYLGTVWVGTTSGNAVLTTTALPVGTFTVFATFQADQIGVTNGFAGVPITVAAVASGGSGSGGGGGGGVSTGGPASGTVAAGGTFSSDDPDSVLSLTNPLTIGVQSPNAGTVSIVKTAPNAAVAHYRVQGIGATITAPAASTGSPLTLVFKVFDAALTPGLDASDLTVMRDGVPITSACTGTGATPDPCLASQTTTSVVTSSGPANETTITVRSSHASTWDVEAAQVGRIAGANRIATAVAASQNSFPAGPAGAVVLARADDYPDALVGAPLAAAKNAPLLLTQGAQLPTDTAQEIARVLPAGGTIYLLGGTAAIPATVASELATSGYQILRYAGVDRFATAVAVAGALGDPSTVLLATGTNFPDALSAGPAAAHLHGAVLLTNGTSLPSATSSYLSAKSPTAYAVGGPAAAADPQASAIVGADRYATAAAIATRFFPAPTTVGIATGATFPDALAGGAQLALFGAPLLLSAPAAIPAVTTAYLNGVHAGVTAAHVYGGTAALTATVLSQLRSAVGG